MVRGGGFSEVYSPDNPMRIYEHSIRLLDNTSYYLVFNLIARSPIPFTTVAEVSEYLFSSNTGSSNTNFLNCIGSYLKNTNEAIVKLALGPRSGSNYMYIWEIIGNGGVVSIGDSIAITDYVRRI